MSREDLRNVAAVAAMQALITADTYPTKPHEVAPLACEHADALVAKLAEGEGEGKNQALDLHTTDAEPRNCGTCWHHGPNTQLCYKRSLKVRPDMSCPDWSPIL